MNVIYCSICLNSTSCITRFGDLDDNNINWLAKLKSIVPDLVSTFLYNTYRYKIKDKTF